LLAVQNVCIDIGAIGELPSTQQKKKSKEQPVRQVTTKPVRPSLTQVRQKNFNIC